MRTRDVEKSFFRISTANLANFHCERKEEGGARGGGDRGMGEEGGRVGRVREEERAREVGGEGR